MKRMLSILVFLAALISTFSLRASDPRPAPEPRLPANALAVPLIRQATSYSCGTAALLSVLYYWNVYDGHESSLYPLLETTPKDGTEPPKLAAAAKSLGLRADMRSDMTLADLRLALARNETVILSMQAWRDSNEKKWADIWDSGHYVVLVGMDAQYAYVMDPSANAGYAFVPLTELLERWHDAEDRHGVVRRYLNFGIAISGTKNLATVPGPLVRME